MVVLDEIGDDKSGALRIKKELLWRHRQHNGQEHWQNGGLSIETRLPLCILSATC